MRALTWFLVVLFTGLPCTARAGGSAVALVERGIQLRREHRDAEALDLFRQALEFETSARTRAQIALAEQALGQWVNAEKDMNEALAQTDDAWIRGHTDALDDALAAIRHHLGTLSVESNLPGAELWVNGAQAGTLPGSPLRIAAGDVEYELRFAGHPPVRRRVKVAPEASVHEIVEVAALNDVPESVPAARVDGGPPVPPQLASKALDVAPAPTFDPGTARRAIAWGLPGGAGALLTAAVAAQVVREESAAHYNDDALCFKPGLSRDAVCGIYRGRAETATTVAITGYAGAGVLAIASGVLFLGNSSKPASAATRLVIHGSMHGLCAEYSGQF